MTSELLAAGRIGGHSGRARDRSAEAKSKRRVTPKGWGPLPVTLPVIPPMPKSNVLAPIVAPSA